MNNHVGFLRCFSFLGLLSLCLAGTLNAQWVEMKFPDSTAGRGILYVSGSVLFYGFNGTLYRSCDYGDDWVAGPSNTGGIITGNGSDLYTSLSYSPDNGITWTTCADSGLPKGGISREVLIAGTLIAFKGLEYISTDHGNHFVQGGWSPIWNELFNPIVAVGSVILNGSLDSCFRSPDLGNNWEKTANCFHGCIPWDIGWIVNGSRVYVRGYNHLRYSDDGGVTWNDGSTALPVGVVDGVATSGSDIFVASDGDGISLTTDFGTSWKNLGCSGGFDESINVCGEYLIAGRSSPVGGDYCRRLLSEVLSTHPQSSALPEEFHLEQNYPNPFNPNTTISYQLPTQGHVTLTVFDALGREIATLVNGEQTAGYKSETWEASNTPSGVYFYRLQAGTSTETRKLLLLK